MTLDYLAFDCDNHYYEALDAFTRHLDPKLRRHPARLLPVAARHPDQTRLLGVVGLRLLERSELLEQAAGLV